MKQLRTVIEMIYLRKHPDDPNMVEIYTKTTQRISIWATVFNDLFYEIDGEIYEKLKAGDTVKVKLVECGGG
jgi:diacylglycerol kinase family enzyme